MEPSDPLFIFSLIVDMFMLVDLPIQIMLFNFLRTNGREHFGHVFVRCQNCIIACNIALYFVSFFISEPACLGIFPDFYKAYPNALGTIAHMSASAFSIQSEHWNAVLALSRLVAVVSPINYDKIFNVRLMNWITFLIFTWTVIVTAPIATVGFRFYEKSNNSIIYSMKGPTALTKFYNYYTAVGTTVTIVATLTFYIIASISLLYVRFRRHNRYNIVAVKLTLVAFIANTPKIALCYAHTYNNLAAFYPELKLEEMSLDLYMFFMKNCIILYAMSTTFLIIIFFPQTRRRLFGGYMAPKKFMKAPNGTQIFVSSRIT